MKNIIDWVADNWNLLFGVILAVISIGLMVKCFYERKTGFRCKGMIVDFSKEENGVLFPVVKFIYGGEEYCISTLNGSKKPKKGIGAETEIIYVPKNQKYVIEVGDYKDVWICLGCMAIGIMFTVSAFL